MNIVIADGYTVNPGDLSWKPIAVFGQLTVYDRTRPEEIKARCTEAEILITNKLPLKKEDLVQLPSLKLISVLATGYNVIDVQAAKERNILVCNAPAYGTASVAQHAIALMLEICNRVGMNAESVSAGDWSRAKDWAYSKAPLIELAGKTLGIVGFGNIGQQTARIAAALGMEILYYSTHEKPGVPASYCSLEELFSRSDIISLHCPLRPDNTGFVNASLLRKMKPSSYLINTARGQLVNEKDLADALNEGLIAGAGLDVLSSEPPEKFNPLLNAKNCLITPHNAWMTREARERIINITAENINAFVREAPVNVVNA